MILIRSERKVEGCNIGPRRIPRDIISPIFFGSYDQGSEQYDWICNILKSAIQSEIFLHLGDCKTDCEYRYVLQSRFISTTSRIYV